MQAIKRRVGYSFLNIQDPTDNRHLIKAVECFPQFKLVYVNLCNCNMTVLYGIKVALSSLSELQLL